MTGNWQAAYAEYADYAEYAAYMNRLLCLLCVLCIYMSGHSKWHNIQQKKGKADAARGNLFTKLCKAITMAAQTGGGDSTMNFSLRLAIERAKTENVPKDNIERAVQRGTGALAGQGDLQEVTYEGYGPGGVGFLAEAVTDNVNRTVSEIKHILNIHGGSLGGPGSVQWQFERMGVIRVSGEQKEEMKNRKDQFELSVIDAGAADIIDQEEGIEIRAPKESFQHVLAAVEQFVPEPADSGLEWVSKEPMALDSATEEKARALYEAIEELDDVSAVYMNVV